MKEQLTLEELKERLRENYRKWFGDKLTKPQQAQYFRDLGLLVELFS